MKWSQLILFVNFLTACAGTQPAVQVTDTLVPPTVTNAPTETPLPTATLTPSPTPIPISWPEFYEAEKARLIGEYNYGSWEELVSEEVESQISRDDRGGAIRIPELIPYDQVIETGMVLDITSVPVTTEYWTSRGVTDAVVLEMAFSGSTGPSMVLTGFVMNDGSYKATMPLEVGPDERDWSDDIRLDSIQSLESLRGRLLSLKSVDVVNVGINSDQEAMDKWNELRTIPGGHPIAYRHFDVLSDEGRSLFEAAVLNPDGYSDRETGFLQFAINIDSYSGYPSDDLDYMAFLTYYLAEIAMEPDSWIIGEIVSVDGGGTGIRFR